MDARRAPLSNAGHAGITRMNKLRFPLRLMTPHAGLGWLLMLEVAVACLLWQLAWQSMTQWRDRLAEDSGIDEQRVLVVAPLGNGRLAADASANARELLSRIDGVERVSRINQVPYGINSWNTVVRRGATSSASLPVSTSFGDSDLFDTLGLRLQAGRVLRPADNEGAATLWQRPGEMPVVITRGLAEQLFPGQQAVGRMLHGPTRDLRVVGVVAGLPAPLGSRQLGVSTESSMILPAMADDAGYAHYLVRVSPGQQARVASAIQRELLQHFSGRPIALPKLLADLRPATLQAQRRGAWTWMLCALAWSLLTLLSLGAAEMLWVQRSTSRISLHRALGASRAQIRGSVHWDLFRLVAVGCVLGLLAGMQLAPRLTALPWTVQAPPPMFALGVMLVAIAISQVLATWPARRAANVAPHHVTRKPWVRL